MAPTPSGSSIATNVPMAQGNRVSCYSALPDGYIRLLRLMPHRDQTAALQGELFDYPLRDAGGGSHPFDALSYAWGSLEKTNTISINQLSLPITANLHAALSRLRDRFIERIIWVDAVCINQEDLQERGHQVQLMPVIYTMASRVIVWLGIAEDKSEEAIEEIHQAANGRPTLHNKGNQPAILALLRRAWFKRIWVLQEIAAAQQILIICGSMEIDGNVFCSGLSSLKLPYKAHPDLQSLIPPATYLIKRTILRSKLAAKDPSLNIRPLSELVDMYHIREASDRRDKVYALLGMSSDNHRRGGLTPNYKITWETLFQQLIRGILGEKVSLTTWEKKEIALIRSKGYVLGQVSSVEDDSIWDDKQNVGITWNDRFGYLAEVDIQERRTLQSSAKPIQKGDFICLLQGASKPTILRLYKDYFACIVIAIAHKQIDGQDQSWIDILESMPDLRRDFLVVWDWEKAITLPEEKKEKDRCFTTSAAPTSEKMKFKTPLAKGDWVMNIGHIWGDVGDYEKAIQNLQLAIELFKEEYGAESPHTTAVMGALGLVFKRSGNLKEGMKLRVMADLIARRDNYGQITERVLMRLAESFDRDVIVTTLSQRGSEVIMTDRVLEAAASNQEYGEEIVTLLLDRAEDKVKVTKAVVKAAAENENSGEKVMRLLLDRREKEVEISEEVLKAVVENRTGGKDIMRLLVNRRGCELKITGVVVKAAIGGWRGEEEIIRFLLDQPGNEVEFTEDAAIEIAASLGKEVVGLLFDRQGTKITTSLFEAVMRNWRDREEVIRLLLERGADGVRVSEENMVRIVGSFTEGTINSMLSRRGIEAEITGRVIETVVWNFKIGTEVVKLLFKRQGNDARITERAVEVAAGNHQNGEEIVRLLFELGGSKVKITRAAIEAAARNENSGEKVMIILLDRWGSEIEATESVLRAAAKNRSGKGIIKLLLDRSGNVVITEAVVKAAAGNPKDGKEIMRLLLDQQGDTIQITEGVLNTAVGNNESGGGVMRLLLDRGGKRIKITEEVVEGAAKNSEHGEEIMKLLLDQEGNRIIITDWVVRAAAENKKTGEAVMRVLLDGSRKVEITEAAIIQITESFCGLAYRLLPYLEQNELKIVEEAAVHIAKSFYGEISSFYFTYNETR